MKMIAQKGRGVVVVIREPTQTTLSRFVKERQGQPMSTPMADLRQYGIGAQILQDLGVRNMVLLSNSQHKIVGLEGYGIHLLDQQPFG
jgi:3,4-dihydroxy 2-butanone 4-phosphate synthase/GTP cyclohydrolase II